MGLSIKGTKGLCLFFTLILVLLFATRPALAAHPLVTDDVGTQGKGKSQLEFTGEYVREEDTGINTQTVTFPTVPVLSYGLTDRTDIVFGASYQYQWGDHDGETGAIGGMTDTTVELKHRFFEGNGFSFALKPGMTIPTGNESKGFGAGRMTYHLFFIASKERRPWAFHLNLGYLRNENSVNERRNLWHASVAGALDLTNRLKLVGDIGIDRDPDRGTSALSRFALGGLIYSISEKLDVDIGLKLSAHGGTREYSIPLGITLRF